MYQDQVGHIPLALPPATTETHVFAAFKNASLISVGQLCYDGCQVIFNNKSLQVLDSNKNLLLICKHNKSYSLLDISLTQPSQPSYPANSIIHMNKNKKELAQFLHAAFFSPASSTYIQTIKNNHLTTSPGLIEDPISKHLPLSTATQKGQIKQDLKNLRPTTKAKSDSPSPDPNPEPE